MIDLRSLSRRNFERLWHSHFWRSVVTLASGTAFAQIINIAFAPLIARMYGPEAFGVLGTFMAILAIVIPLAALAYPIAIVLPREDCQAIDLVRLSFVLSVAISLLVASILAVSGNWIIQLFSVQAVADYIYLIPCVMFFAAMGQIAQQWLIRVQEYGGVARSAVGHSLIMNMSKVGVGWIYPVSAVLITLSVIGYALHAVFLYFGARKIYIKDPINVAGASVSRLKELAIQYRDFPLYRAPQNFINAASQSAPVLLLAVFFGPIAAGCYALAKAVMGVPITLVGKAVGDVFYPRVVNAAHAKENIARHILRATAVLFIVAVVPFVIIFLFGSEIFGYIFGAQWINAGIYAQWLALFFLFNFINKPAVAAVPVLGIQRGLLVYEIFSTGLKVFGLFLGFFWFDSDIWAVALFSVFGVVAYVIMMVWIIDHAVRKKYEEASR